MINLSQDIFENCKDVNFILLGKLNQDALENFFIESAQLRALIRIHRAMKFSTLLLA